ncbi:serine-rich adhesin for platelets [Anopheles moucheti]|uniref:serine-rich adhesin for platelets n=1 Tax=Anopheles moucheti TaxID=186751 RepID=UPI0022F02D1B|nr:serine-rich adhesin for platelets [Anopheles moucheti]XP_052892534.1 serine-rich adhesin for platelets [Anopheles moucheti]XP_052892535.1 serine-rich adhesin for platelets [Anopheles moucheti]
MPRIDPMKLLVCLSVLLAPNGGIRNAGEVRRLANLMAKFSKKLVSKAIYIQILKCTETELLGQFMQTGGWTLVHTWLVDGIASKNWPLIQELLELLLCCPVDVERLKINSTPRLVKSLSTDSAHESVKVLATKLVEQWLYIVKAPKQLSPMVPINQSELSAVTGLAGFTEGKQLNSEAMNSALAIGGVLAKQGGDSGNGTTSNHYQQNGYTVHNASNNEVAPNVQQSDVGRDDVDGGKKTFQTAGGEPTLPVVSSKKTSLVLKITTKNGKQVVAKVIKPNRKQQRAPALMGANDAAGDENDDRDEDDEEDDQEEVVVNIESGKSTDEPVTPNGKDDQQVTDVKKLDLQNGVESSKERNSSSSKDKDRHHHSHRDREKDRKGSSSSVSRSSSSKSSSSSSSSKHKSSSSSSSKSSSSSSSRSKDKDRHSSSSSSSSKHKSSSSSSSSKSNSSGSKSSSSSDKHRDHKDKSNHSASSSSSGTRDSKNQSQSFSSSKLSRKNSRDDSAGGGSNDSGSETSSTTNTNANGAKTTKSASASALLNKKPSISIEVRNPENRPKTVKTYNSQFRSHGLIEEAPPPPSRKGLKKPSSTTPTTASSNTTSSPTTIGSTAIGTVKRSSPISSGRETTMAGSPVEKKPREDPLERPGSIKLIPPKRQHALVESDMFMDALSATLRKDVKKRKRRTSGSEGAAAATTTVANSKTDEPTTTNKPASVDAAAPKVTAPGSPTPTTAEDSASEATTPTTPTSPKVPTIAPMSFYRDTLAEQEEENGAESVEDGAKKEQTEMENNGQDCKKSNADDETEADDEGPLLKKPKRVKCELNEDDEEKKDAENSGEKTGKKEPAEGGDGNDEEKTELMDEVMNDVEKKIAEEAEGVVKKEDSDKEEDFPADGKKPPGPGCGPDGPPGVLVIHRRKGPKKQLRWRTAEELEEVRYFELDVTERCNVTKSFTDMKQMERVDERQKFMLSRKVGSEDIMVERTTWRPLVQVDNVPPSPDGNQSLERNVQRQRERGCLQALYFNKHMIPDSAIEPDPADIYQTADPVHIPLEDVTGNPDSVNDFTSVPWPDPKSTPPHESGAFNSPFFPSDLPPGAGFGPGGFPPPFAPGAAASIGPGPWNMGGPPSGASGPRPGVLPPGMFPLNQPPPGMGPSGGGGGPGGSPNMMNMPLNMSPNVPPPGMFPGATNFNAPPPELGLMQGGGPDMGGRRGPPGPGGVDFRNGPPPQQQWVTGNRPFVGGNNPPRGGAGFGNRGGPGIGGNWNNRNNGNNGNRNGGGGVDRGRMGDDARGNYRGHWLQNNRGHNRGGGGRKW